MFFNIITSENYSCLFLHTKWFLELLFKNCLWSWLTTGPSSWHYSCNCVGTAKISSPPPNSITLSYSIELDFKYVGLTSKSKCVLYKGKCSTTQDSQENVWSWNWKGNPDCIHWEIFPKWPLPKEQKLGLHNNIKIFALLYLSHLIIPGKIFAHEIYAIEIYLPKDENVRNNIIPVIFQLNMKWIVIHF